MQFRGSLARTVALLFVRSGVLPHTSSSLATDPDCRLAVVLAAALNHLRSTRASLDQWALFLLVIAYLVVAVAFLATAALLLVASAAHAQTVAGSSSSSLFKAPQPQQDIAQNWINYLFLGQDISNYVSQSGQTIPQSQRVQTALQAGLAIYSDAILIVAAIVLFYHLITMVVETAHQGVPMGKRASQIWAPIRLVVAIGLLVPISGGLNSGQYLVISIAEMGSGLASNVWQTFLNAFAAEGMTYRAPQTPYVRKIVQDLVDMQACQLAYNFDVASALGQFPGVDSSSELIQAMTQPALVDPVSGVAVTSGNTVVYTNSVLSDKGICGSYEAATAPAASGDTNNFENQLATQIAMAHNNTLQSLVADGGPVTQVAKNVKYFIHDFPSAKASPQPTATPGFTAGDYPTSDAIPPNSAMEALVTQYQTTLQTNLKGAMGNLYDNALNDVTSSGLGWVAAGAWFNTIARGQGEIVDAARDGLPKTIAPQVAIMEAPNKNSLGSWGEWLTGNYANTQAAFGAAHDTAPVLMNFDVWAHGTGAASTPNATSSTAQDAEEAARAKLEAAAAGGEADSGFNLMDALLSLVDKIGIATGAWASGPLMFQFSGTANPLAEVSYLGHSYLSLGLDLLASAGAGSLLGGALSGIPFVGKGLGMLAAVLAFIGVIVMAGGFTLAFLVPLMPFIRFFFATLTWILAVFEGVVFMPLIALAHLNPEGEGLPGSSAKQAYFLILNIFLRPVLMVFGLVVGLLIFFVAISFLNMMYSIATASTGASSGGFHTIAKLVFSLLYVGLAYICANNCFKAIGYFPEHALRWLGSGGHHERMGSPGDIATVMTGIAAYGGKELGGALQKPGQMLQGAHDKQVAEKTSGARHSELIESLQNAGGGGGAEAGKRHSELINTLKGSSADSEGAAEGRHQQMLDALKESGDTSGGSSKLPGDASKRAQNRARSALDGHMRGKQDT